MAEPRFRRLLAAQGLSSFGDSALYLSVAIWVKDLTGSNGAAATVFFTLGVTALLAPLGGYLVDRVARRKRLLIATELVTGVLVLALLLVHTRADLWLVYVVMAGYGMSANVIGPATSALLKDLLDDDALGSANAARQVLAQGLRLLSPLVGAGLYAGIGGSALAVFDTLTFLGAAAALAGLTVTESAPPARASRPPFLRELAAGFGHIAGSPLLRRLSITVAVAMLGLGLLESIDFAVVAALGHAPSYFGVLMSVQGAGSILAGLLVAALMRRIGETAVVAVAMAGFAVGAAGLAVHSDAAVAAAAFVIGFAVSCYAVGFGTALQRYTPPRLQGRVSTATFVLTDIPQTASIAAGAALIATVDYRLLLAVLSVVTLACAVALARAAYRPVCPMSERVAGGV